MKNIILNTDSYKASHYLQLPEGTEYTESYIESRGGLYNETIFFGLQAFLIEYLEGVVLTQSMIEEADTVLTQHGLPFNRAGWQSMLDKYGGHLPIEIWAVPEGTLVPTGNVMLVITNTDPEFPWLPSYLETALLRAVWYPTTVATRSWNIRQAILKALHNTGTPELIDFKLHDFGARGVSSYESAELGGLAHLVAFKGTDTISALLAGSKYYAEPMAGFSIPASEHSTMTINGEPGEIEQFRRMIRQFGKPGKLFACVSDSYDIYEALVKWALLKDDLIASGAKLVIRPDSGDPAEVCMKVLRRLDVLFGSTINNKGFKVLNNVAIIYGDGMSAQSISMLLDTMEYAGFSADNIAFGMGGGLLQNLTRDTNKFAMKCSYAKVDGVGRAVFKDPITDKGKSSKRGQVCPVRNKDTGEWRTIDPSRLQNEGSVMAYNEQIMYRQVFHSGNLISFQTLEQVRDEARKADVCFSNRIDY